MDTKHTPGPWRVYDHNAGTPICNIGDQVVCDKDKEEVCVVRFNAADSTDNAPLIAAAPDLLAALEGMLTLHYDKGPACAAAVAAIGKARGE